MNTPAASSGTEQRMTFRLLSYWQRVRKDKDFPALSDINISEITEIWHHTFVIDLTQSASRFQYFGPQLGSIFNQDYTGEDLAESMQDNPLLDNSIGFYEKVVQSRAPMSESLTFFHEGKEVRARSLILPLSSDGSKIDYLIGTANYKVF